MNGCAAVLDLSHLNELIEATLEHMRGQGYSLTYLQCCRSVWRNFQQFLGESSDGCSEDDIVRFLISRGVRDDSSRLNTGQRVVRSVMRILREFARYGCHRRRCCSSHKLQLSSSFLALLQEYETSCGEERCLRPRSLRCRRWDITRFLHFLESNGVHDVGALSPRNLTDFISSQLHYAPKTVARIVSDLRSFLRFLYLRGSLHEDISPSVPKVRIRRDARIPSVWSNKDVEAILAAVDRTSPKGKRDYAILLLACRLGLRVGDIRRLRLEHLDWHKDCIQVQQAKTGVAVTLPLTEEVGEAIVDYLRHGRPTTQFREVFLRATAPIEPFAENDNLHHIIAFYRQRAQIGLERTKSTGMHSLRHSLATQLLERGTPLETIASVMGHLSLDSTRIYTQVDVAALRTAALDLEVPHA